LGTGKIRITAIHDTGSGVNTVLRLPNALLPRTFQSHIDFRGDFAAGHLRRRSCPACNTRDNARRTASGGVRIEVEE
jgi:hypothetical protein